MKRAILILAMLGLLVGGVFAAADRRYRRLAARDAAAAVGSRVAA